MVAAPGKPLLGTFGSSIANQGDDEDNNSQEGKQALANKKTRK